MRISRKLNNCINFDHERAFGIACNNDESSFDEFILNFFKIHHRNLQDLAVEILNVKLDISTGTTDYCC